jgi:glucose-1-phosphate thymidylyltransferase
MRAIIPVAGVGTRLRPHTYTLPKVLINVAGKPIIGHILDKIIADGIDEATIVVGYLGDKVEEYVRRNYRIKFDFVYQEERKGLGHSIYLAQKTSDRRPVLIILGDTIFDVDLTPVLNSEYTSIGAKIVDDARRFGVVEVESGFVTKLVEKPETPTTNLAVVGLYYVKHPQLLKECLEEIIRKDIRTKGEYQLTDGLQLMLERGEKMTTFRVDGWYDCGKPETLLSTNQHLLDKKSTERKINGVVVIPPVYVSTNCEIARSIIGPYTTIADGAIIEDSLIRNSIIGEESRVQGALLENSIICNNAVVRGTFKRVNAGDSSEIDFY